MEHILDNKMEDNISLPNDFFTSRPAKLLMDIAYWARICAIVLLLSLAVGAAYQVYYIKIEMMTEDGGINYYHLCKSLVYLITDIVKLIPLIIILQFTKKYIASFKNENIQLACHSLKLFKLHFIWSIIAIIISQILSMSMIFIVPYLIDAHF
jgi:hypothetical protein